MNDTECAQSLAALNAFAAADNAFVSAREAYYAVRVAFDETQGHAADAAFDATIDQAKYQTSAHYRVWTVERRKEAHHIAAMAQSNDYRLAHDAYVIAETARKALLAAAKEADAAGACVTPVARPPRTVRPVTHEALCKMRNEVALARVCEEFRRRIARATEAADAEAARADEAARAETARIAGIANFRATRAAALAAAGEARAAFRARRAPPGA